MSLLEQERRRRAGALAHLVVVGGLTIVASACTSAVRVPPPRPNLPAVQFVPPCDPAATVGLTAQGVEELKRRDAAWKAHVQQLEAIIRGSSH